MPLKRAQAVRSRSLATLLRIQQETRTWEAYVAAVSKVLRATQPSLPEEIG